ncbi:MAG: glycine oxidase ThiO [Nitrosomonadales bacterium]|nr:glycine oxidase ThiO [Nitrosomonadales bacterium]
MTRDHDILVIGAGVMGLGSALELLKRGAGVTLLERGLCGNESSWAGGGILSPLCPWDYPDAVTRLTTRGAMLFSAWAQTLHDATGIDPEYETSGMLVLPPFDVQVAQQWCAAHQVPAQRMDDAPEALLLPGVAQVRNPRLMRALRRQVEMLGGRIIEQCAVREIRSENNRVRGLLASCGEFSADSYVVTAGAWSKEVLGQHALQLDIKPMRGQMLLFKFATPPLPHIVLQGDLYLIPRRDGHLLVGSTLEDVGFDKSTTQVAYASLRQRAEQVLPQLRDMPLIQHWAGLRPASPHNIPVISRHPHLDNLYVNAGHFRYGVTMATASIEILMNEMTNSTQAFDVDAYRAGWIAKV